MRCLKKGKGGNEWKKGRQKRKKCGTDEKYIMERKEKGQWKGNGGGGATGLGCHTFTFTFTHTHTHTHTYAHTRKINSSVGVGGTRTTRDGKMKIEM